MRDIKFRALSVKDNKYITGFNMSGFSNYAGGAPQLQRFGSEWNEGDFLLEQYTGLKDKNGKEIYEGDIIINKELIIDEGAVVKWENGSFSVGTGWPFADFYKGTDGIEQCKIIGNIHENCHCGRDRARTCLNGQEVCMNCTKNIAE